MSDFRTLQPNSLQPECLGHIAFSLNPFSLRSSACPPSLQPIYLTRPKDYSFIGEVPGLIENRRSAPARRSRGAEKGGQSLCRQSPILRRSLSPRIRTSTQRSTPHCHWFSRTVIASSIAPPRVSESLPQLLASVHIPSSLVRPLELDPSRGASLHC